MKNEMEFKLHFPFPLHNAVTFTDPLRTVVLRQSLHNLL